MSNEIHQRFLKGINRRFPREESTDPDTFYTLQNARLFKRGETGQITRMPGFGKFNTNTKDYSDVLDIDTYDNFFVVFYKEATLSFGIDIFDKSGTLQESFTYSTDEDTDSGEIVVSNQSIFFSPHNKILYYNNGNWTLEDFISSIPKITNISKETDGSKFSATIEINSGSSNRPAKKAFTKIKVNKNNIPSEKQDSFKVQIINDGYEKESAEVTIDYTDNRKEIADKLKDAITDSTSTITDDWEVKDSFDGNEASDREFFIVSLNNGESWNGYTIRINGSDFNITEEEPPERPERNEDEWSREDSIRYEEALDDWEEDYDRVNSTLSVFETTGGRDQLTEHDPLTISLTDKGVKAETTNINNDTASDIATKINNALSGLKDYDITQPSTTSVKITAKRDGKSYNTNIELLVNDEKVEDIFDYSIVQTDGVEATTFSGLGSFENYWYKIRYRYLDGHVTSTSLPAYIDSGANANIQIDIEHTDFDINGDRPKIEIYRKKAEGNFSLIDTVASSGATHQYIDDGRREGRNLNEKNNIWTKYFETQEVVEDRLVRANINYFSEVYSDLDFTVNLANSSDTFVLPNRQKTRVFIRPQYEDGSLGYHEEVDSINVDNPNKKIELQQNSLVDNPDKDISSLGVYLDLTPFGEFDSTTFNSLELNNQNLPAIGDQGFFPINTRVFFGLKHIKIKPADSGYYIVSNVGTWNSFDGDGTLDEEAILSTIDNTTRPDEIEFLGKNYIKVKESASTDEAIYELDLMTPLKQAVRTNELYIRIDEKGLGGVDRVRGEDQPEEQIITDDEVLNAEVKVLSVIDNTTSFSVSSDGNLILPDDNRVYLSLEDSVYDDIDASVNNYNIERNYNSGGPSQFRLFNDLASGNLAFELIGFKRNTEPTLEDNRGDNSGPIRTVNFVWDKPIYDLNAKNRLNELETLIYIGSKNNDINSKTFDVTGFEDIEEDNLNYAFLNDFNYYENLIKSTDINVNRKKFPSQIIWSDPLTDVGLYSGGRNMSTESFLSITENRGEIRKIVYIYGGLYIFCEKGVAKVNVGEVVSQQKGGEMYVDSSSFLTDYAWLTDSLKDVKKESIIKHENAVYFTDGQDVFRIANNIERLASGNIDLDPEHDYTAFINNEQREYILCDLTDDVSWTYNIEFQQWTGPHTFVCQKGSYISNKTVTGFGSDLVEHDIGTTFNGESYTTIIENAADDSKKSFYDKNFRKFYIDSNINEGAIFKYGKDLNSMRSVNIDDMKVKNGYKHQGIHPEESNSKNIFWSIEIDAPVTIIDADGIDRFGLSGISWKLSIQKRR